MKQIFTMDVENKIENGIKFANVLRKNGLKGEFYVSGFLVDKYPGMCRKIAKYHMMGGHGYMHEDFMQLSLKDQKEVIEKTVGAFKRSNIKMDGWRFPYLSYKNESMNILADLNIADSSIRRSALKRWEKFAFIRNWLAGLKRLKFFLPIPYSSKLKERPWDVVDLGTKNFWRYPGRIITHCYNYPKFEKDIKKWLESTD